MDQPDLKQLSSKEIEERLKSLPGWLQYDNKISKEFTFESFSAGVEFINRLAPFCKKIDHHPDIHIYYKKIVFELTRFSVGGKLTERDFTVAKEIERLFKEYEKNK